MSEQSAAGWLPAPDVRVIGSDEIHVWRASLDSAEAQRACWLAALADDERQRAARFHFERDRNHFIAARGQLRYLLGGYLKCIPAKVQFAYGARGKPYLPGHELEFNLSHSHERALFAFAHGRELGIDLEWMRADFAGEEIAERFFSRQEVAVLRALPAAAQVEAFFNCWTRKEAYIKARGEGLAIELDSFDVTIASNEPARLLAVRGAPEENMRWSLCALDPGPGYAAALAVERPGWKLKCYSADG